MSFFRLNLSLSVLGLCTLSAACAQAEAEGGATQVVQNAQDTRLAQSVESCPYDSGYPRYYVQIATNDGDPLRVRSSPNGTVVGAAQSGWSVRLLEWSRDGAWARILAPWDSPGMYPGMPASEGWVSAAYLKDLGRFCEKPRGVAALVQPEVFGAEPVEVQSDWLAMADALSESLSEE